jgi:hypothetical protein
MVRDSWFFARRCWAAYCARDDRQRDAVTDPRHGRREDAKLPQPAKVPIRRAKLARCEVAAVDRDERLVRIAAAPNDIAAGTHWSPSSIYLTAAQKGLGRISGAIWPVAGSSASALAIQSGAWPGRLEAWLLVSGAGEGARQALLPRSGQKESFRMSFSKGQRSGRRDSNPRRPPWQGGTLPLSYSRGEAGEVPGERRSVKVECARAEKAPTLAG